MNKKYIAITLGIMCCLLTCGIVIQLNATKNVEGTVGKNLKENELRDEVLSWKEKYDKRFEELEKVEDRLEEERKKSTSNDETSVQKKKELETINTYLGLTNVEGEGIIITLKDNITSKFGTADDIVHYSDLRAIVNELKNAGAEAISINDQRIVPTTVINCVGTVVQINDQKIGVPFVIRAIGNQEGLYGAITRPGGYLETLQDYVIVETKKSNKISISKYDGILTDKYLENVE